MKAKQIKEMSKEDIKVKLLELRKEQIKLNTQISSGTSLKSPALVKKTKKTIARLLHELKKKEGVNG
jgi:ribosomal protein L29